MTSPTALEADYLVVGCGAVAMAFVDTLVSETDAKIVIVDQHHGPGGHWNDAYPFVRLHQPSAFYGVNSRPLGGDTRDVDPLNLGMCERATGAQILEYYEQVMSGFLSTGRVQYFPMSTYDLSQPAAKVEHTFTSLLTGAATKVKVRKRIVDTTHLKTAVPSTHAPKYSVAQGITCIPLNGLPKVKTPPTGYVVVGGGKTGIDACLWLLEKDVSAGDICWIIPRDSWFQNRANVQPAPEFFEQTFGALAAQMEAISSAESITDLFARLETADQLLRLDPTIEPSMYHAAVVSHAELKLLRTIKNVVRMGRVLRVEPDQIVLEKGSVKSDPRRIYVDCSASAAELRPPKPVFEDRKITPQFVRAFQPTFSAAFIAHIEASDASDETKNLLCSVVPLPDLPLSWLTMQAQNMANQFRWSKDKDLGRWIVSSRLDGFTALSRSVSPDDTGKMAVLMRFRNASMAASMKIAGLIKQAS